jgi:hypothetical protein
LCINSAFLNSTSGGTDNYHWALNNLYWVAILILSEKMKIQNVFKQQLEALRYVPSTNNVKKFGCKNTSTLLRIEINLYYT